MHTTNGEYAADAVLIATGRKPNTDLDLQNTDVKIGDHGEIIVNEYLQTDASNVYALGDVKGGMQFTYISLDDFRIVKSNCSGKANVLRKTVGLYLYYL